MKKKKNKQSLGQRLYLGLMTILMIGIASAIVSAMQVNPPTYLDEVVRGVVSDDVVETAVVTDDDSMLQAALSNRPFGYFAIMAEEGDDDSPGRRFDGPRDRDGGRGGGRDR